MAGTREATLSGTLSGDTPFSFVLDHNALSARVVLRSRWEQGRRFDLARLIGDRLIAAGGALHPATRAYTYRQQAQRSFAAEFLSPFEAVEDMLDGDYSIDRQQDVANHFNVSPMTIDTLLKNHRLIDREYDFDDVG
jgi:Zn-dependent peptidase ImmA (M78 family)